MFVTFPTACAMGCVLSALRGWALVAFGLLLTNRERLNF
jgi:hypothetical protein